MDKKRTLVSTLFFLFILHIMHASFPLNGWTSQQERQSVTEEKTTLLRLLDFIPSSESIDYVQNKVQFQLHTLLTEQRHPKTWNLSDRIEKDLEAGLQMLLSADEDIVSRLGSLEREKDALEQIVQAIEEAVLSGQKIYIFGSGSSGRFAKQMESSLWRPFWKGMKERKKIWSKISPAVGNSIEERLIGEMPGGDPALIRPMEATEDAPVLGRLHLQDHGILQGDVVICITESGEISSVISTILAALDQWKGKNLYDREKTKKKLFFVYNNPDETLLPFERSRKVLEEPGISKINLTTGPQAITGSTRMQAATINAFVLGHAVQTAIDRALRRFLPKKEMTKLGFQDSLTLEERLEDFATILKHVKKKIPVITKWTMLEAKTYSKGHYSTYLAYKGLMAVLTDSTERATTFRVSSLDTIKDQKRKCWAQVWTTEASLEDAWKSLLGRPFRGLSSISVEKTPADEINGSQVPQGALENLKRCGSDIQFLYDFSFSDFNLQTRGPQEGDLGALVAISPEEFQVEDKKSDFLKFVTLFLEKGARTSLLFITGDSEKKIAKMTDRIPGFDPEEQDVLIIVPIDSKNDPLGVNQCIALKIILNAHSTAVMTRMGRVIGNTTVDVSLHSLKNIDRATYLVQSLVNDVLIRPQWVRLYGIQKPTSYGEANAVLYEALSFMEDKRGRIDGAAEVVLSVVRILESLRLKKPLFHEEAMKIVQGKGLRQYLRDVTNQAE